MTRIVDERSSGKTNRLMTIAKEQNAIFVCSNPKAMEYKAKQYGIEDLHFVSYSEFSTLLLHKEKYVIDELESFIIEAFGGELTGYTLSIEE